MYGDGYSEVDWGVTHYDEEDTVIDTYKLGDKVQLLDGSIGYINTNKTYGNSYNIIGPYRLWSRNNVNGDDLTLVQEADGSRFETGDAVIKANSCRIPSMKSNRALGYIVETNSCRGSSLPYDSVNVMFSDSEVHTIKRSRLIKMHEVTIDGTKGDEVFNSHIDNLIDAIGTSFLNGDVLKVQSAGDKVTSYHLVVHNDKFRTLTEVYISNGFTSNK